MLWTLGTVTGLVVAVVVPFRLIGSGGVELAAVQGSWLMPVVPPMVSAATGAALTPALESASTQSVKRALETGGFALLSRLVIEAETQRGTLVAVPVRDAQLRRELRAVRRGPLTGAGRDFWAWLRAQGQPEPTLR